MAVHPTLDDKPASESQEAMPNSSPSIELLEVKRLSNKVEGIRDFMVR